MKKFIIGTLISLSLSIGTIFAQNNLLPDGAEIEVKEIIHENESVNLAITMMKNGSKINNYMGTIVISITDEKGTKLTTSECTLPDNGYYTFGESDLGYKEFQKGLSIKRIGKFFVEVTDMSDDDLTVIGKKEITVIKDNPTPDAIHIDIISPFPEQTFNEEKIVIIAQAPELKNSPALIYIDKDKYNSTPENISFDSDGMISTNLGNIDIGRHTLYIEVPNIDGEILGQSDTISFIMGEYENSGVKVSIDPEEGLIVGDKTEITVKTDEMVETVRMKLSDRLDDIIMTKEANGEFVRQVYLLTGGEISISIETSSLNNSTTNTYPDAKKFSVLYTPEIGEIQKETDNEKQTAKISWEILNGKPVYAYKIKYWAGDGSEIYGEEEIKEQYKTFSNVPFDTIIYFNITPIRKNSLHMATHGSASKTIQFIIQKPDKCGNGVADEGEDCSNCAQDLGELCETIIPSNTCGNGVADEGEDCSNCAQDLGDKCKVTPKEPRCTVENIATRTTKIGDSYYLIWDKVKNVTKYIVYSSTTPEGYDKVKVYETSDTSYEYPFDYNAKEEQFAYFWIVGICDDGEELELTGATKVQVGPAEHFFLLICMTFLIYSGIKLFRQTEE